jgi:hypothetical protein
MRPLIVALSAMLAAAPAAWADEEHAHRPPKGDIRTEGFPKPVTELLEKIQQLSKKIEPEIAKLGSRLGEELSLTVKKLCEELQCQEHPEQK